MAINRTYNYNGLRSEVTKEIKEVVSEGATQGLTEGMAEALAQGLKGKIKINGNNIVFDDSDLKDGIRVAFNKAINDLEIKDAVKKQGLDISQLFNIDANALKQEIEDSLAEVDINPKSIKANKKLLGQLLAAEFRGIEVKDLDGAVITQSFVQSIQRAAKISNEQIADINDGFKRLGDSSKQLDVFAGNVTELLIRMQNAADGINDTKREIAEFNQLLEGLDDQSFDKINDSLDEFQEKIQKGVMSASEAFAELRSRFNLDAVADDLKEFNNLLDMTLTGFGGKSKPSAQQYWKSFRDGFETANADVKELLKNLGLLNQSGGVDVIESGANNYGGIVGEQNTAIIRKNNGNITPENALELKNALDQAADAGVNCGRIIDVVSDKTNEFFVEVQSTQAGKAISTIGDEFESINTAALEASDEQIQKLFSDLKKLYDLGIQIDPENLTNILYDPSKGFGFIDLDLGKGDAAFKSFEEMISAFRTTLGYQVDDIKTILEDEAGSKLMEGFVKRIANASSGIGDAVADLQRAGLDELAKSLDSHSPSKKAENIGESVPQGEAKGIRNEIPEAEKAAKELGRATMDALEMELKPVSGNQYADILNRSFETKNKTEANNQLKAAYEEFQKYFSEGGIEDGKILREMSDAGRKAGYEYYNALEEAVRIGVSKSRIEKYLSEEFWGSFDSEKSEASKNSFAEYIYEQARVLQELGNPELDQAGMKALSDYMYYWDLIKNRREDFDFYKEGGVIDDAAVKNDLDTLQSVRQHLDHIVEAQKEVSDTFVSESKPIVDAATTEAAEKSVAELVTEWRELNDAIKHTDGKELEQLYVRMKAIMDLLDNGSKLSGIADIVANGEYSPEEVAEEIEYIRAKRKRSISTPSDSASQVKAESDAHAENAENIRKEVEAKKESEQYSSTPETTPQIKAEADAEGELADKKKETAEAAKAKVDAGKESESVSDNSEAIAEEEKEKEAVDETKESIDKKTAARKEEQSIGSNGEAAEQNRKEAEAAHAAAVEYEKKEEAKRAEAAIEPEVPKAPVSVQAEDLSPVLMQLTNIIGMLEKKNNLFIREGSIVAEQAAKEVGALKEVAEVVASIVKNLQEASSKKINISFNGLESLNSLVGKDLTGIVSALQSLANVGEVNMSVKTNGIKGLEALTKLDIGKLDERLKTAYTHIETFAQDLNSIEIKDDSLFDSLRNLLKDGEALKSLAAALKASKKQIDNVTEAISKPKEQPQTKVDLSEWKELNKVVKEYYELKNTDSDKLTQSEQGRLTEIEGLWVKVRGEVEKTTAALKEQGQSTKLIEDVTRAYTAGFAEWQNQQMADGLISDRTDLSKLSERFNKRLSDYPSKYVEEAAQKVQKLTTMVDALNAKPIDAAKPEDIAQIEKEIEAAKTLANEIQQGFNSADWRVANQTKVSNLQNEISMYMKNFSALSEETKGKLRALNEELDHVGSNEGLAQAVQKFNKIKIAARDAGEEGTSFFSKMGKQIEHLNAQAFAMYLSWQDIIRYIRQAAGAVIELDSALTELRKVSDASTERLQQSFETSAKTAKELGSTVDSVINQTADWSRLKTWTGVW